MQSVESGALAPHKGWTLALSSVGVFMAALDALVVTTALPVLRTSLNANVGDLEWTINAYVLTFACLLLPAAALADRFGVAGPSRPGSSSSRRPPLLRRSPRPSAC